MKVKLKIFNKMKNAFLIPIAFIMSLTCSWAQIDNERMARDIEVAENVLASITEPERGEGFMSYGSRNPYEYEGNYVDGFGVIFSSSSRFSGIYFRDDLKPVTITVKSETKAEVKYAKGFSVDSLKAVEEKDWIDKVKIFLADYAHLISQLKPSDKIMVTNGPTALTSQKNYRLRFMGESSVSKTKIEVTKQSIDDLQTGKLSREKFMDIISVETTSRDTDVAKDIQLMANIFETLYQQDMSDTYYASGNIYAEKINGLGVVLQMKVYSSTYEGELHRLVTQNKSGLTQKERDNEVKELYPKFVEGLKSNLVQYGRTVKSIEGDEKLMLNVLLTQCKGCGIPESVELAIKASDLAAYNSGKISESQAISKVKFEEIGNQ